MVYRYFYGRQKILIYLKYIFPVEIPQTLTILLFPFINYAFATVYDKICDIQKL